MAAADTKVAAPPASAAPSSSSRSSSSSTSSPQPPPDLAAPTSEKSLPTHDPTLKPAASILANPHEAPPPASSKKASALKAAFIPAQPGRLLKKKSGVALGKSFQRTVPLPGGVKHEGGEVLEVDPRGREASTGDGVVLPGVSPFSSGSSRSSSGTQSSEALDFPSSASDRSRQGSIDSSAIADDDDDDGISLGQSSSAGDQSSRGRGRTRTDTESTRNSSVSTTSSSHSCAIRFAPLPVSGRLKRSTSITIGVAARSQMLQSQGSGRGGGFNGPGGPNRSAAAAAAASQQMGRQQIHGGNAASSGTGNGGYYGGAPQQANDVIDLGEEISKKAKSAWKKMLGSGGYDKPSSASAAAPTAPPRKTSATSATKTSTSNQQQAKPTGDKAAASEGSTPVATPGVASDSKQPAGSSGTGDQTPRRPASPLQARSSLSQDDISSPSSADDANSPSAPHPYSHLAQGSHQDHFPGVAQHHLHPEGHAQHADGAEGEGAQTPRAAMQRRLSTGAFLGGLSLRHMQQDRRREFGGHEEEDREAEEAQAQEREREQYEHEYEHQHQHQGSMGSADPNGYASSERHPHHTGNLVTPMHNPEKDEFHDAPDGVASDTVSNANNEEEEGEDEEELREAERLAEDSSRRGAKGAGVEVVHHS